jgi:hypothetical protein
MWTDADWACPFTVAVTVKVSLDEPGLIVRTNADGAFRIAGIPIRAHTITVRALGFDRIVAKLIFESDSLERDFLLVRNPVRIAGVRVAGAADSRNPKLSAIDARRSVGLGHYITQEQIDSAPGRRLSSHIQKLPGLTMQHGNSANATWAVGTRGSGSILKAPAISPFDQRRGAKRGICYSAVYLDGVSVYSGRDGESLFDIDQLEPSSILAVEYYASAAQMPPGLNQTTAGTCGLLMLWTR